MQPQLKMGSLGCDTIAQVSSHQLTVLRRLGIAEHPVLASLEKQICMSRTYRTVAGRKPGKGLGAEPNQTRNLVLQGYHPIKEILVDRLGLG